VLTARADVVHHGRSMAVVHIEILNPEGKQVAIATESVLILPGRPWDRPVHVADEVSVDLNERRGQ
ncbi:MAG: PaaI family thioesterase, partial [Actinomycetota bacterium]